MADPHRRRRVERDTAVGQRLLADLDIEAALRRLQQRELAGLLEVEHAAVEVDQVRVAASASVGARSGGVVGVGGVQ